LTSLKGLPVVKECALETIQFLSEPVGSDKTTAAIEGIRLNSDESYLFVSPTKALARDIEKRMIEDLKDSPLLDKINLITEDTIDRDESVREQTLNTIRDLGPNENHILITTTTGLRNILTEMGQLYKAQYNLLLDEGIDVLERHIAYTGAVTPAYWLPLSEWWINPGTGPLRPRAIFRASQQSSARM